MSLAHVPRNEIPTINDTRHDRLAVWRVAGVLAGRLDEASAGVPRDAGARRPIQNTTNRPVIAMPLERSSSPDW